MQTDKLMLRIGSSQSTQKPTGATQGDNGYIRALRCSFAYKSMT